MPIFQLYATPEHSASLQWKSSTIDSQTCWVEADGEENARWAVTQATIIARLGHEGDESPIMPWLHADYALCVEDAAHAGVRQGYVLDAGGNTHDMHEYDGSRQL
jgi:hypothetical protein